MHVVQVLGAGGNAVGAHVCCLANGLVARGVAVTVCGPHATGSEFDFEKADARFVPVGIWARATARGDAAAVAVLRRTLRPAAVVHAHGLRSGFLTALALRTSLHAGHPTGRSRGSQRRRPVFVVTLHEDATPDEVGGAFRPLVERRVARAADVVLGISSELVDRARRRGSRDARLSPVAAAERDENATVAHALSIYDELVRP